MTGREKKRDLIDLIAAVRPERERAASGK